MQTARNCLNSLILDFSYELFPLESMETKIANKQNLSIRTPVSLLNNNTIILTNEFESECISHSVMSNSLQPSGLKPTRLPCPWNSPSNNTGVDSHSLLQGIFLTQGSNLGLLPCRQLLYRLSHQGSPQGRVMALARVATVLHMFVNSVNQQQENSNFST